MAKKFLKYFPIVTLVLTMVAAPVLACVCVEYAQESHACCPDQGDNSDAKRQAQEKEPCCEFKGMVGRSAEIVVATPEITVLVQASVPERSRFTPQVSVLIPQENSYLGIHAPPELYLKNHSMLL